MATSDDLAIHAALDGDWERALMLNEALLKTDPTNVDALNRLAYAHAQLGNYDKACQFYTKALTLDPYNLIAKKNLEKFHHAGKDCAPPSNSEKPQQDHPIDPDMFLEDAEKTRIVHLVNLGPKQTINALTVGEQVYPVHKRFEMQIKSREGVYVGALPDDIGRKLMEKNTKSDKACECFIKNVEENSVSIYLKWHP